jgi:hypothetical protein
MTTSVQLINVKNILKVNSIILKVKGLVREKLQEIDLNKINKTEPELITFVCRLVWCSVKELKLNIKDEEKQNIVIDIFNTLFTLTALEIDTIKSHIKFSIDNKLIKGVSNKKWLLKFAGSILKKFL